MRYLVTGGCGFIGSCIVKRLCADSRAQVTVLDNLSTGSRENLPGSCRFVEGDVNDRVVLERALEGVDVVLHEAAFVSIRGSFSRLEQDLRDNCWGALAVFDAAGQCGVRRVVFASSMAVYGEPVRFPVAEGDTTMPVSPYGLSKLRGEMYGRILSGKYGYSFVALRYFNTYGVGQAPSDYVGVMTSFINMVLDGRPMTIHGDGEQTRDFVWVEDVAEATILAAQSGVEGVYNVGSGSEVTINEVARMIQKCAGGTLVHVEVPPGDVGRMCADISRARGAFGYRPRGVISKQLPAMVEYWRRRRAATGSPVGAWCGHSWHS